MGRRSPIFSASIVARALERARFRLGLPALYSKTTTLYFAPGAKYKVVVFEYNAGNPSLKRALSNALATIEAEKIGDLLPIACSANCLQPDGQNDNGWDQ